MVRRSGRGVLKSGLASVEQTDDGIATAGS